MPPVVIAGALAAGGAIAGSSIASSGAKDAARAQAASGDRATEAQMEMFRQTQAGQRPFQEAGYAALPYLQYLATGQIPQEIQMQQGQDGQYTATNALSNVPRMQEGGILNRLAPTINAATEPMRQAGQPDQYSAYNNAIANFNPDFFQESPAYKWQLQQGQRAIDAAMARRGKLNSSTAVNALADYSGQLGANEWDKSYGRLLDLTNIGRGATTASGSAALSTGNALANIYQNQGAAQAQGINAAAQQRGSMWSNLGALPLNIYNTQQYQNALAPQNQFTMPQMSAPSNYVSSPQGFQVNAGNYSLR